MVGGEEHDDLRVGTEVLSIAAERRSPVDNESGGGMIRCRR